jgi:Mrp family chromosome partitioning ATPase
MALWDRKLVMVTGKGGVGKTTLSAALARTAVDAGRTVLAAEVSNDASTTSPLMQRLGHPEVRDTQPVRLFDRLYGVRLVPSAGHRQFLQASLRVKLLVDAAMRNSALNRFLMAAPAFPEVGTLFQLVGLLKDERFDHVIVDLPATGHALGLASLPRTVLKVVPSGLIARAIQEGLDVMTDPDQGRAILVTLPEAMPVSETMELQRGLESHHITVGAMVLNRIPIDPFTTDERTALDAHLAQRRQALMGSREFRRLERSRIARQRFEDEGDPSTPRVFVPDLADDDEMQVVQRVQAFLTTVDPTEAEAGDLAS